MNWAEAIELKWKPKIAEIHMMGFFLDPGMKRLPECSDQEKRKITWDIKQFVENVKIEDCVEEDFERRFSHVSTASEDSIPGVYSRRRARVIDLNSSDLFEDIIDEMR